MVDGPENCPSGALALFIGGTPYSLMLVRPDRGSEFLAQFRLTKVGGKSYAVTMDLDGHVTCDCPDFTYRRHQIDKRGCKHISGARTCGLLDLRWEKK